jgi:DNA (cytosine-5)-methyltransferase 1
MADGSLRRRIVVDSFAGGGGASHGIHMALGRSPDVAINHDPEAVALHALNHPEARHYCENVWSVDPRDVDADADVDLLWASPDCKHFSKAKGGKPVEKGVRGLAWVVVGWARKRRPRVIILENVEEFATWGPLLDDGRPDPTRKGLTFRRWVGHLRGLGYAVEWRELRACDFGAPTTRKRLFVVARCDGQPIVWPTPTHAQPGPRDLFTAHLRPWRTAAECIDWSIPCPSIFDRKKPLAEKTLARIARGLERFVIGNPRPFIVPLTHAGSRSVPSVDEPFRTVTSANRGELALCAPTLVQTGYGERDGQAPRALDLHAPLGTVVAGGAKHALVAAFLAKHYGGGYTGPGVALDTPTSTVTTVDHHALVTSHIAVLRNNCDAVAATDPLPTVIAGGTHLAEVRAFLVKYFGTGGAVDVGAPLDTVTTRDRFGLVVVDGVEHAIVDIGMRMLTPRELARAQGFPDDYALDVELVGVRHWNAKTKTHIKNPRLSKTAQVRLIGNSVCPPLARALVAANVGRRP